jgi:hypothetical protein
MIRGNDVIYWNSFEKGLIKEIKEDITKLSEMNL